MKIIVGLGNPGKEYLQTRHNVGFMVIDQLRDVWKAEVSKINLKLEAEVFGLEFKKEKIILVKPLAFMNQSGKVVLSLFSYFSFSLADLWLVHDDFHLTLGRIKIVENRQSAGHKGVESVMKALKTKDLIRFRLGTRPKEDANFKFQDKKIYVLEEFKPEEKILLQKMVREASKAIKFALEEGLEKARQKFNALKPE